MIAHDGNLVNEPLVTVLWFVLLSFKALSVFWLGEKKKKSLNVVYKVSL